MADWDERYSHGEHIIAEPMPILVGLARQLEPGRALDLACGPGRHALFLAERGWQVTAVDASRVGIELLKKNALERGVEVEARVANLERGEFEIEPEAYDLIGVFYYLQRDLFPQIRAGVRQGGIVIAAIHLIDENPDAHHANEDYLLRPGELRAEFRGWQLMHDYEGPSTEGGHNRRTAELVARKV
ncbi:MAG TPA: methyltransferase domain-containing protein [Pyrinomonadaceae bacterium]|jgi:SAM-dependent methyltransferase|nr:methyltransferase domain-containing protein [Pyrinomonadaceae bacterium]